MISAAFSFLQLCMAAFVIAAPIAADETMTTTGATPWQYGTGGGIIGLIILILDIIVWSEFNPPFPSPSPSSPCPNSPYAHVLVHPDRTHVIWSAN